MAIAVIAGARLARGWREARLFNGAPSRVPAILFEAAGRRIWYRVLRSILIRLVLLGREPTERIVMGKDWLPDGHFLDLAWGWGRAANFPSSANFDAACVSDFCGRGPI